MGQQADPLGRRAVHSLGAKARGSRGRRFKSFRSRPLRELLLSIRPQQRQHLNEEKC